MSWSLSSQVQTHVHMWAGEGDQLLLLVIWCRRIYNASQQPLGNATRQTLGKAQKMGMAHKLPSVLRFSEPK